MLTLKWLHNGLHKPVTIGKWMIWIWFGLDGTGIGRSAEFHWLLGPAIMIAFAFLGNTLFVTITVSLLSNTFGRISANAVQEMQYRRSVLTFEGVKADALFAFMPPVNLLALAILLPLKFILSPRWFHKVIVFSNKALNAPLLLLISWYERRNLWSLSKSRKMKPGQIDWKNPSGPIAARPGWWSKPFAFWDLSSFSAHGQIEAVFDEVPDQVLHDDEHDQGIGKILKTEFHKQFDQKKKSRQSSINDLKKSLVASSTDDTLRQEFPIDSDGDDESESAPEGHKKLRRRHRKDSIIDFHAENVDLTEANARLQKLEDSVDELKMLLRQILKATEASVSAREILPGMVES